MKSTCAGKCYFLLQIWMGGAHAGGKVPGLLLHLPSGQHSTLGSVPSVTAMPKAGFFYGCPSDALTHRTRDAIHHGPNVLPTHKLSPKNGAVHKDSLSLPLRSW